MAEPGDIAEWHRKFAVDLFNRTWDLIEKRHRSEDDDLDILTSALASLHHWRQVGEPKNLSVSDWQVSPASSARPSERRRPLLAAERCASRRKAI